jgi:hypothetical protein
MAVAYWVPRGRPRGGETYLLSTRNGKLFTTMAPATRFSRWKTDGTLERINRELNCLDRKQENREAYPSVFCIDSQSVKLAPMICEYRGLDAHKKINAGPPVRPKKRVFSGYGRALVGCRRACGKRG